MTILKFVIFFGIVSPSLQLNLDESTYTRIDLTSSTDFTSYFGYDITFLFVDGQTKIAIGVPGNISSVDSARGSIRICSLTVNGEMNDVVARCNTTAPDVPVNNPGLGTNLASNTDGVLETCSTWQKQECVPYALPGFCYQTEDFGRSWKLRNHGQELGCSYANVDVIFVLDGSGSVKHENFERVKQWVVSLIEEFEISGVFIKIGVIVFSNVINVEIELGYYETFSEIKEAVENIRYPRGRTHTASALAEATLAFENSTMADSENHRQVMILLADGNSNEPQSDVEANALKLRNMGVLIYAVGVGITINTDELKIVVNGNPSISERVFEIDEFEKLGTITRDLQSAVLEFALEGSSNSSTTTRKLELAQAGFSSSYSSSNTTSVVT